MGLSVTCLQRLSVPPEEPFAAEPDAVVILTHELPALRNRLPTATPARRSLSDGDGGFLGIPVVDHGADHPQLLGAAFMDGVAPHHQVPGRRARAPVRRTRTPRRARPPASCSPLGESRRHRQGGEQAVLMAAIRA